LGKIHDICCKAQHEKTLIQNLTSNPKALYGYIKSKNKIRASISKIVKLDGSLTKSDSEAAKELNRFFQSVFTQEDPSSVPEFLPRVNSSLNEICITEEEMYCQLSGLNPNKTQGPDGLHPKTVLHP